MNVKELIQHLQGFDEEHHVVIAMSDGNYPDIENSIVDVEFDGRNCVIKIESGD